MPKNHLAPFKLMGCHPGVCQECATDHEPEQPHNQPSLHYQYHFYANNGRWPTWTDAMSHCSEKVKAGWIDALTRRGIEVKTDATD